MAINIRHTKVTAVVDDGTSDVGADEWNEIHTISVTASDIPIVDAGSDFTATTVEGALDEIQADNEAHVAAADPHTGYRLESATIGTADLTADGVTYAKIQNVSATSRVLGRITSGSGDVEELTAANVKTILAMTAADVSADSTTLVGVGTTVQAVFEELDNAITKLQIISVGGGLLDPTGARNVMVWRAPYACTVTNVRGHAKGGTNAVINARLNQTSNFLSSSLTVSTMNAWADGGAVQNAAVAAGDDIEIMLVSISGAITEVNVQVDLTRDP